jgi:Flp pilus assembly protein TadD
MRESNYTEAFIHWSHAIKLDPEEPRFYMERSKCFLQQEQVSGKHIIFVHSKLCI